MKKLLPLLSVLFLISIGFSQQEYNNNDLVEMDNGLWTEKFSDEPITGKVYGYYGEDNNPKKVHMGNIRNGKKEGKWVDYYHSTGKIYSETTYRNGKLDGVSTVWYENGQIMSTIHYNDGIGDGLETLWYENGQKESEIVWKGFIMSGPNTYWYENGQMKSKTNYKDGKRDGLFIDWYENGQKQVEGTYKDGEIVNVIGMWNEDGSPK